MENFTREKVEDFEGEKLQFQIREWEDGNFKYSDEKDETYHIYAFGATQDGKSVCIDIQQFTPYFYVKVPSDWTDTDAVQLTRKVEDILYWQKKFLISTKLMEKKDIDGFNNHKKFKFVRFVFNNESAMKKTQWIFKKQIEGYESIKFKLYDVKTGPLLTFTHIRDILMSGWVTIDNEDLIEIEDEYSRCQICYGVKWKHIKPLDKHTIAPFVTLSFDLECFSSIEGKFPDPEVADDQIIQIGSGFHKFGKEDVLRHVIVLGECDPVENCIIVSCETEEEVITKWVELVEQTDPDQFIGYNIDSFDWIYIWKRAELLDLTHVIGRLSRLESIPSEFKDDTMESKAYGLNIFRKIKTPGVGQMDLLHWFRKNTKLESYKLDFVSETYLGEKKRDIHFKQIFSMAGPDGTPSERAIIADYCGQDTFLPIRLMIKLFMFQNLIEMSKISRVCLTWLLTRGESIKVHSMIAYAARKENFLIPLASKIVNTDFEGATVLNPKRGAYLIPVSGLDFASLYPSIIIAHNLCPTTFVKLPKYDNIEGVDYSKFQWEGGNYKFVQNVKGLIPGILERLWEGRKHTKKLMAIEKDPDIKNILNSKQLAQKISMNSVYGSLGAASFSIPCKPISATTTYIGRQMIDHSKKCAEEFYDGTEKCDYIKAEVIYGDSIIGNESITLKKDGKLEVKRMDNLAETEWKDYSQFKSNESDRYCKQQSTCDGFIMTSNGWRKITRVIRHKTNKRLFRVVTNKGIVTVTEDHSLLRSNGDLIKPKKVKIGERLMHRNII
jgi:DNA polymerase delta subunit 1